MANTEFYCDSASGANINAGSTSGSPVLTLTGGDWVQSTGVFTKASSDLSGVSVGMFASVYVDGATTAVFVGRITAVDDGADTITVSLTAKSGTAPTDGTGNRSIKVGGAWLGPNGAAAFPFDFVAAAMTNASGDIVRVNFKSGTNYAITAALTHSIAGPVVFQGYTSSVGDGGKATIDGGTAGSSYVALTFSGAQAYVRDFIFSNNGGTAGGNQWMTFGSARGSVERCVFHDAAGEGLRVNATTAEVIECEAYACNKANASGTGGFHSSAGGQYLRCISHNNTGSNAAGFSLSSGPTRYEDCVADTNGGMGWTESGNNVEFSMSHCVSYNNANHGVSVAGNNCTLLMDSCAIESNGSAGTVYGLTNAGTSTMARTINNAYYNNRTAATNGAIDATGTITATASMMGDPANGNFLASTAEVKGLGRGSYTQTSGYSGSTTAYPDVGLQHQESAGGGVIGGPNMRAGMSA